MTRISKVLVILCVAVSLSFLGAAAVSVLGGPNWEKEALQATDFVFEQSSGPQPQWSAKERISGESVGPTSPVLAEVLIAAYRAKNAKLRERLEGAQGVRKIDDEIATLEKFLDEATALIETDRKAMRAREDELAAEYARIQATIEDLSNQGMDRTRQAIATRQETGLRREEVFRVRDQLREIRADTYRIVEQIGSLHDLLERLTSQVERLKRRAARLQAAAPYEEKSAAKGAAPSDVAENSVSAANRP